MNAGSPRARSRPRNAYVALWLVALVLGIGGLSSSVKAQDIVDGQRLYINPQVQSKPSCADSSCHGLDPAANLNRIKRGANSPAAIAASMQSVPAMAFLRDRTFSSSQLSNLAAYIADPRQASQLPIATISPAAVLFDTVHLGTTSNLRIIALTNTGPAPLQLRSISIDSNEFVRDFGSCNPGSIVQPYNSCSIGILFSPALPGLRTATLTLTHNGSPGYTTVALSGTGDVPIVAPTRPMVEYRNVALDYYFMTSRPSDIALLDSLAGWARTGKSFNVYVAAGLGATAINRYYFDRIALGGLRGSHFYTLVTSEKEGLEKLNPRNIQTPGLPYDEDVDSYAFAPLVEGIGGACAAGQLPVYRLFRNPTVIPDNANHRFTTDVALYNSFVTQGWDGEGVKFCVPR